MAKQNILRRYGKAVIRQGVRSLLNLSVAELYTLKVLPLVVKSKPIAAQIEITNVCNLKCKMCAHSIEEWKDRRKLEHMSLENFKLVIDRLPFVQSALINGVGEPLMNPHLVDMINYAYKKGIVTHFFTNAMLMTEEIAFKLVNARGLTNINVSIDGGTQESYERIRAGAKFDVVCANLKRLIEIRNGLGRTKPYITVFMVAMHRNINEIPLLVNTVSKLGVTRVRLHGLLEHYDTEGDALSAEDVKSLEEYRKAAAEQNVTLVYGGDMLERLNNEERVRECREPWKFFYVNASGWINPCSDSFYDKTTYMGNIFQNTLEEIWNGEAFIKFRNELKTGMPDVCRRCPKYGKTT